MHLIGPEPRLTIDNSLSAILTCGSSGLGLRTVRALREAGAKVAIFDLNALKGKAIAVETGALFCECNIKRLGHPHELASMAMIRNSYNNAQLIRLDGAIRMPPK